MNIIRPLFLYINKILSFKNIFLYILFENLLCYDSFPQEERIKLFFRNIYSKMNDLSSGNRFVIDNNKICINDKQISDSLNNKNFIRVNKYICLYNDSIYLLFNGDGHQKLLDIDYIEKEKEIFYDFNIYKTNKSDIDFIITFSCKSEIKIYHYEINITKSEQNMTGPPNGNGINISSEMIDYSIFNAENELCKSLSCHINNKLSSLICFYIYRHF